jgi:hypothetical protein
MKIATPIIALFLGVRALALAQSEIRIPTDAELQRMERGGIATSPLGTSAGPKLKGSEEAQNLPNGSTGPHDRIDCAKGSFASAR